MVEGMFFNETDIDKIYAYIRGDLWKLLKTY
jgi:hypothetical protein